MNINVRNTKIWHLSLTDNEMAVISQVLIRFMNASMDGDDYEIITEFIRQFTEEDSEL